MIKRAEAIELLNVCRMINDNMLKKNICTKIENNIYETFDRLFSVILDLLNVPTDTSIEYDYDDDDYFVRDGFLGIISDYVFRYNDYNEEEVIDMLLTLNE